MTYSVIYHSQTGNTEKLAKKIYQSISAAEKSIYEMQGLQTIPSADVYFIGFGVRNGTCGIETMNCLDKIKGGKIALFATCGFIPAEQYRNQVEHNMMVWLPEHAAYLGMYLCQGKIVQAQAEKFMQTMPEARGQMEEMFQEGSCHPDESDLENASQFAANLQLSLEQNQVIDIL